MVLRGVNCHSPFKHYMMFHGGCHDGGNYGSVFNTTYNINCGGHGGFWGGFGYGLGNMLGGFLGNMFGGGMFGGGMFGMGNMFGMGGLFSGGMGMPWMNFWGGGSSVSDSSSCKCGCKHKDTKVEKDTDTPKAECIDEDRKKLADYAKTVPAALNDDNLRLSDLKKSYDRIKADRDLSEKDENHKETDLKEYDNLLQSLQDKANAKGWGNLGTKSSVGLDENPEDANGTRTNNSAPGNTDTDDNLQNANNTGAGNATVKINGEDVKISDLTPGQIGDLTIDQIKALTPDQAKILLGTLDLLCKDDDEKDGVKATTNYKALLLTKQAGLTLACGHNTALDALQSLGADPYLNGTIEDITEPDASGTITFTINDDNATYQISCKEDDNKYKLIKMIQNKTGKYKEVVINAKYEIKDNDDDDYGVRNGKAAVK